MKDKYIPIQYIKDFGKDCSEEGIDGEEYVNEVCEAIIASWIGVKDTEYGERYLKESIESEWIPIKEKEPDTCDHVLVTFDWGSGDLEVSELDYWVTKYAANNGDLNSKQFVDAVVAWQRMPEPYQKEQEGDTE